MNKSKPCNFSYDLPALYWLDSSSFMVKTHLKNVLGSANWSKESLQIGSL